jgi:hypothetical protein
MNLSRISFTTLLVLFAFTAANGQNCADFMPQKEGAVLKHVTYDKKGKVTGSSEMAYKEKTVKDDWSEAVFMSTYSDKNGEAIFENEVKVECKNGVLYLSSSKFLDPSTMSAYESMDVEVDAEHMDLPLDAKAGTELKDGKVTAVVRSNGMKLVTISVEIFNRKVEAIETIDTPAGSFECIKSSFDIHTEMGFVKMNMSSVEWYSRDVGPVRSESYDKKGKLASYTVLESID